MMTVLWGLAIFLTITGALLYWGARVLRVEGFYVDATLILFLALACASLAQAW